MNIDDIIAQLSTAQDDAAPQSAEREATPDRDESQEPIDVVEEHRETLRQINEQLANKKLSQTARTQLLQKRIAALNAIEQTQVRGGIDQHPHFDALVEDLVRAVIAELGAAAPLGVEHRIADRFERLQAARQAGRARSAA